MDPLGGSAYLKPAAGFRASFSPSVADSAASAVSAAIRDLAFATAAPVLPLSSGDALPRTSSSNQIRNEAAHTHSVAGGVSIQHAAATPPEPFIPGRMRSGTGLYNAPPIPRGEISRVMHQHDATINIPKLNSLMALAEKGDSNDLHNALYEIGRQLKSFTRLVNNTEIPENVRNSVQSTMREKIPELLNKYCEFAVKLGEGGFEKERELRLFLTDTCTTINKYKPSYAIDKGKFNAFRQIVKDRHNDYKGGNEYKTAMRLKDSAQSTDSHALKMHEELSKAVKPILSSLQRETIHMDPGDSTPRRDRMNAGPPEIKPPK